MTSRELSERMDALEIAMGDLHRRIETCENMVRRAVDRSWALETEIARMMRVLGLSVPDSV